MPQDPQLLIEIFLNYDCDLGATSMFNRIVSALSRVRGTVPHSAHRMQWPFTMYLPHDACGLLLLVQ